MANVIYRKSGLKGILQIPPSKSAAHRAVLCAALSQGNCEIGNLELSDDLTATVNAVKALGGIVSYDKKRKTLLVQSADLGGETAEIDCLESGSTLRFMIPVAAALGVKTTFYGKGRLPQRPWDLSKASSRTRRPASNRGRTAAENGREAACRKLYASRQR
ncbi:MAG: hypothetical protein ACLRQ4_01295 [Neglectibacter timonensis]